MQERPANDSSAWASRGEGSRFPLGRVLVLLAAMAASLAVGIWIGMSLASRGGLPAFMQQRVKVEVLRQGSGPSPTRSDVALVNYKGSLPDGKVFDQNQNAVLPISDVVQGFAEALVQMRRGGKYKVFIPSDLAYGSEGNGPIPPNADLIFEIELLDFKSRAEIEQIQKAQQEQQKNTPQAQQSPASDNAAR